MGTRRKLVLLVEGNADSREICTAILQHHGYRTLEAKDGVTGLQLARSQRPDLVMMDVLLPVLDGWTLAQRLRGSGSTAAIPIVALTSLGFPADQERGRRAGFAQYLVKPCSPSRVVSVVRTVIGPPLATAEI